MHYMSQYQDFGLPMMGSFPGLGYLLIPFLLWNLVWTGWALWLAARRGEPTWFVALLVLNTAGLLEIFYIFVIAKQNDGKVNEIKHE
jgi:hypothetical protein